MGSSDRLTSALGTLLVNIGELEVMSADFVWLILGVDKQTGMRLTKGASFDRILSMSRDLFRARVTDTALLVEQAALWKRLDQAKEERNKFVHASWTFTLPLAQGMKTLGEDVGRVRRPRGGTVLEEFERMTPERIEAIGSGLADLFADLAKLWDRTSVWLTENPK